jgi:hypothetical protein
VDTLRIERHVSFEQSIIHLSRGDVWKITDHPDQSNYPGGDGLTNKDRGTYKEFLMQQDPVTGQKIRMNPSTGRPLGSEAFIAGLENKLY